MQAVGRGEGVDNIEKLSSSAMPFAIARREKNEYIQNMADVLLKNFCI